MKLVSALVLVVTVATVATGAWVTVRQSAVVKEESRQVAWLETAIDSIRGEKRKLRHRTQEVGRELSELPDSSRVLATGYAIGEAYSIAKQEVIYDNHITRQRNLKRSHAAARDEALHSILVWDTTLGGVLVVLGGVYFFVRRRAG